LAAEPTPRADDAVLSLRGATLRFDGRTLWEGVDLDVRPGEFIAVLGANGTGKTSLLRVILGQQRLTGGEVLVGGEPVTSGNPRIGYVPQQKLADEGTPLRARDVIGLGLDGRRWGFWPSPAKRRDVDRLLADVGATAYAKVPVSTLSGGEQQRLRIGQALASEPRLLLADEPLASLDLTNQRAISELIDRQRRARRFGVLFVTHDVNPVLDMVDRVLYLAGGRFRVGTPDEVLRSEVLSELYGSPVDVIHARGRIIVVGTPDAGHAPHDEHHDAGHGEVCDHDPDAEAVVL
jgi:zinc/manganese transport system ATP-binding protein